MPTQSSNLCGSILWSTVSDAALRSMKSCAVSCTTDYETLLNCSCSGLEPPETLLLQVYCRLEELKLNASCQVSKQQSFCVMYPDIMEEIADVETMCSASAFREKDHNVMTTNSSEWPLRYAVRPWPPFNIHVKNVQGSYTISWDTKNPGHCLVFRVRIWNTLGPQTSVINLESKESVVHLEQLELLPGVFYGVDVQAKLCPGFRYEGPWSDWSSTTLWTSASSDHSAQVAENNHYYWLIPIFILIMCLSVGFPKAMFCQKRLKSLTFIPNPREFFKPLYNSYQGNFKAWVMPSFTEHNSLKKDTVMDVKLHPTLLSSLNLNPAHSSFHSLCHVSISTVSKEDLLFHCSGSSDYPTEESYGPGLRDRDPEKTAPLHLSTLNFFQDVDDKMLSGNDYPLMDLDTIDSGFEECSSPPVPGQLLYQHHQTGPTGEQLCDLHRTNYVKQWSMSHQTPAKNVSNKTV
ncbi:interleukin-21 receptor-like [Eucyclogobius newberryi]|uniref:interleukin-21 receptor-like n=1 Tax=Eucyclogobius newberryi TaxID=166745 RepID=UPI003B5C6ACF